MSKSEELCLAFDPFSGDETDVLVQSDRFVVTRRKHKCQHCGEKIKLGSRVRALSELNREDRKRMTFYFCEPCCETMVSALKGDDDSYEERSIQWKKLKARMEAGI